MKFLRILNDLIHAAGMRVVQEGIETPTQLDLMRDVGVDLVQGSFLSLPLTGFEAVEFVQEHAQRSLLHTECQGVVRRN